MAHIDIEGLGGIGTVLHQQGIDIVRLAYSDLIGTERGRDVLVSRFERTVSGGVAFCRSVYATSPMGDVIDIAGGMSAGLPDVVAYPDLDTLTPVPWEAGVAQCLVDIYNPDGTRSAESPRNVLRNVVDQFDAAGRKAIVGPELEFFLMDRDAQSPTGWSRYGEATGNVYVAGFRGDPDSFLTHALRQLAATASRPPRATTSSAAASSRSTSGIRRHSMRPTARSGSSRRSRNWRASADRWRPSWPSRSTTRAGRASTCICRRGATRTSRCSTTRTARTACPTWRARR